jgi:CubicO group peptidase (beta-lactamase class C family)
MSSPAQDTASPVVWPTVSPAEAGFADDVAARLDAKVADGSFTNLHGVVVARGGALVVERYYSGQDERWGEPLGEVAFGPEVKHDLRSVSKSIVGLLYGIALDAGKVPAVETPLLDGFPAYGDFAGEPARRAITVGHALTMTMGLLWDESLSYRDPRNSEIGMEMAPDRYRYVLEQPIVAAPGTRWIYSGGATALLARLIAVGTGMRLLDYARDRLLTPIGITDVEWIEGADGEPAAASGLRLRPRDLTAIGQLVLDKGKLGGKTVVPKAWLKRSFAPHADTGEGLAYGYQWWLGKLHGSGKPWMAAFGNGGQRLMIVPSHDLLITVTAGNYNAPDAWRLPVAVITDIVFPALRSR